VCQDRINTLALMKDSDRLDLLMDVAGTKFYDQQRDESLKMIMESESRTGKIRESLSYIRERLRQLEDEKAELELHEQLDRERRAVEYLLQKRELLGITEELRLREQERERENRSSEEERRQLAGLRQSMKGLQMQAGELRESEQRMAQEKDRIEKRMMKAIRMKTRGEYEVRELEDKRLHSDELRADLAGRLSLIDEQIAETEAELAHTTSELDAVADQKASVEGAFDGLQQILGGTVEDPTAAQMELARAQDVLRAMQAEEAALADDIRTTDRRKQALLSEQAEVQEQLSASAGAHRDAVQERNNLLNERKDQWREEARVEHELKKIQVHIGKLRTKVETSIPLQIASGLQALKELQSVDGLFGPLIDHIGCDDDLNTAVSVVAKNHLFDVVVDTEDIGEALIQRLQQSKRGRLTFMALKSMPTNYFQMPDGVTSLLSLLRFKEQFRPAVAKIFGKFALVESLREGARVAAQHRINCVTREGDLVNCHGPMTGGSRAERKSMLDLASLLGQREGQEAELKELIRQIAQRLSEIERRIQTASQRLSATEVACSTAGSRRGELVLAIQGLSDELSAKRQQLDERHRRVQAAERHILSVERRLKQIHEFNTHAGGDAVAQADELRRQKDQLGRQYLGLLTRKLELSSLVNDRLLPRRRRTLDDIARLDLDAVTRRLADVQLEVADANQRLQATTARSSELDAELSNCARTISEIEDEIVRQQRDEERLQRMVQNQLKTVESIVARISLLKQREEECLRQHKNIGILPEAEITAKESFSASELRRQLANINNEAKRYRHVNKKAIEQYRAFSSQQVELQQRESELTQSAESIRALIQTLDTRKEEAIARTYAQISDNFSQIFSELEPGARGMLVLQHDQEQGTYTGVAIRVQFGGQPEVTTLAQLSGGQKALVALTLVFAIQRFAPAPFYLFDEVDSALDQKYRHAVAQLIHSVCHPADESDAAQVIFTTFKPELLENCDRYFAVRYDVGHSSVVEINSDDANAIVAEQNEPDE
jgi:structural maintenance of chromosome 3 (chondroitin sulfate proteoglycan 6)